MKHVSLILLAAVATLSAACLDALAVASEPDYEREWPEWRGPVGTGIAPHGEPPVTWSETENVRWKVEIPGRGHASPIVWGERVFLLTAVELEPEEPVAAVTVEPAAAEAASDASGPARRRRPRGIQPVHPVEFRVIAFDRATGAVVWEHTAKTAVPHEGTHRTATWASASAATDGEVLIANFGSNGIYAYDLDGNQLWQRDLGDQETRNAFGEGSSPTIHDRTVVVNWDHEGESFIVALDRDTGEVRWRRDRDEPTSWSSPMVVEVDGKAQVIVSATNRVRSYDLASGNVVWHVGGMTLNVIPTPSVSNGIVYLMSGFRGDSLLAVRLEGAAGDLDGTDSILWSHDRDASYTPTGLAYEDTFYFLKRNNGILTAVDSASGEVLFGPERLEGIDGDGGVYASLAGAAGRVYIVGQNGTTLVLARGRALEIIASNQLDDGFDASPAIAGSQVFLRGSRHLYCLEAPG